MPLIDDTFENHSLQALLDTVKKLDNLVEILRHNQDTLLHEQAVEDAEDTRAS